ncbi:uncharacterized protein LOC106074961 isoform X3 [Biomphalaria glabrata]|nr:uncharacterized protein LOC106074961 isoform X3 [Biomphalaria glabrata]
MIPILILAATVVGQLLAAPVNGNKDQENVSFLDPLLWELINNNKGITVPAPSRRELPLRIKVPILPKRAISLGDFILQNPPKYVFDPDKKREKDQENVFLDPIIWQLINNNQLPTLSGRETDLPYWIKYLTLAKKAISLGDFILQNPPKYVFDPDKKREKDQENVFLDPIIWQLINNNQLPTLSGRELPTLSGRELPLWIKVPILPKRAISLGDFILQNPPKYVFDPDKKREVDEVTNEVRQLGPCPYEIMFAAEGAKLKALGYNITCGYQEGFLEGYYCHCHDEVTHIV